VLAPDCATSQALIFPSGAHVPCHSSFIGQSQSQITVHFHQVEFQVISLFTGLIIPPAVLPIKRGTLLAGAGIAISPDTPPPRLDVCLSRLTAGY
jgi:hypothetical protein